VLKYSFAAFGLVASAAGARAQAIHVEPRVATMDAPISIRATSLPRGRSIAIRASTVDRAGQRWESFAEFRENGRGSLDLGLDAPIRGSYAGVNADGLLTSMQAIGDSAHRARFDSQWSDTVATVLQLEVDGVVKSAAMLSRTFGTPEIAARTVADDGLVGTLFERVDGSRRPGVIVLGGSEGGNSAADVAYQLADHGFTTFALAYFGAPSLPAQLDEIPLEYFDRAIAFLHRQNTVLVGGVGIVGTSKGAEAALLIASHSRDIESVVVYAPSSVVWSCICDSVLHSSWSRGGRPLPAVSPAGDPSYHPAAGSPIEPAVNYLYRLRNDTSPASRIRAGQITAAVLLIAGNDDRLWPSSLMARSLIPSLSTSSRSKGSRLLVYPGAGHLIPKSRLPAGSTLIAGGRIQTGGTSAANAAAGIDAWAHAVEFLQSTLTARPVQSQREAK
jgi:dienelactone hydrolase